MKVKSSLKAGLARR